MVKHFGFKQLLPNGGNGEHGTQVPMAKLTLSFRDKKLKIYPLTGRDLSVGRDPGCGIRIDSLAVEPEQLVLRRDEHGYRVEPAPGIEAVMVNNERCESRLLRDGDRIQVGKHQLTYTEDEATFAALFDTRPRRATPEGWLQIMSGSHLGRTIRLDRALTRVGKTGKRSAMIARRDHGYFISHLEGDAPPEVNGESIGDQTRKLADGDEIRLGKLVLNFFLEKDEAEQAAPEPVPADEREQRRFSRIPFDAHAVLADDSHRWESALLDLSLKGALIALPEDWQENADGCYQLQVDLDEQTAIRMDVRVSHIENERMGLECIDIDLDSITHLRRLVELNLADEQLLERELAALG